MAHEAKILPRSRFAGGFAWFAIAVGISSRSLPISSRKNAGQSHRGKLLHLEWFVLCEGGPCRGKYKETGLQTHDKHLKTLGVRRDGVLEHYCKAPRLVRWA